MRFSTLFCFGLITMFSLACGEPSVHETESKKAQKAADTIKFDDNVEISNIQRRLEMFSKPGAITYILLMNQSGQPILYTTVKGKVTSSGKRLTNPSYCPTVLGSICPSDEGTFGTSDNYIYFWTEADQYIQWDGEYLLSDKPIRVSIEPIVVNVK